MSENEFCSRSEKILGNGLIRRKKGHFAITTMVRATLQPLAETGKVMDMDWKFRAIDSINQTNGLRCDARLELVHSIRGAS